jgi:hypothetical protein
MGLHASADVDPPRHRGRRSPASGLPLMIGALIGTSALLAWSLVDISAGGPSGGEPTIGLPPVDATSLTTPTSVGSASASAAASSSTSAGIRMPMATATPTATAKPMSMTPRLPAPALTPSTTPYGMVAATLKPDTLTIVDFHYDGRAPSAKATVDIHIDTTDENPVTLVLTYAGGDTAGQPGDNAPLQHTLTLSGHLTYDVTDTVDTLQFCYTHYFGVSAALDQIPSTPPAYRDLTAPPCT